MKLARIEEKDAQSALWKKLKAHLEESQRILREKNDGVGYDAVQTAFIRGQLAQLKSLLALERGPAQVTDDAR